MFDSLVEPPCLLSARNWTSNCYRKSIRWRTREQRVQQMSVRNETKIGSHLCLAASGVREVSVSVWNPHDFRTNAMHYHPRGPANDSPRCVTINSQRRIRLPFSSRTVPLSRTYRVPRLRAAYARSILITVTDPRIKRAGASHAA